MQAAAAAPRQPAPHVPLHQRRRRRTSPMICLAASASAGRDRFTSGEALVGLVRPPDDPPQAVHKLLGSRRALAAARRPRAHQPASSRRLAGRSGLGASDANGDARRARWHNEGVRRWHPPRQLQHFCEAAATLCQRSIPQLPGLVWELPGCRAKPRGRRRLHVKDQGCATHRGHGPRALAGSLQRASFPRQRQQRRHGR